METSNDSLYYKARVAERIKRPYDIIKFMDQLIIQRPVLNSNERDLLFTGYKQIIDSLRCTIQVFTEYLQNQIVSLTTENCSYFSIMDNPSFKSQLQNSLEKYTNELKDVCKKAIGTIDNILLVEVNESESCIFYHKTKADYYRYIAEFQNDS